MNNLKKFSTEADYSAATLNYPAVSWVTGTDTVHFNKVGAAVNNKVKIAFTTDACGEGETFNLLDSTAFSSVSQITVNGEPFTPSGSLYDLTLAANTDYLIEYELNDGVTDVSNRFAIHPANGCSSIFRDYDILFPAQVTTIGALYGSSVVNLLLEETTPTNSDITNINIVVGIYVPDSAVNTYKSASGWSTFANIIYPISEYSGNIPT